MLSFSSLYGDNALLHSLTQELNTWFLRNEIVHLRFGPCHGQNKNCIRNPHLVLTPMFQPHYTQIFPSVSVIQEILKRNIFLFSGISCFDSLFFSCLASFLWIWDFLNNLLPLLIRSSIRGLDSLIPTNERTVNLTVIWNL